MTNKVSIKRLDSITKNDTTATEQINSNFLALQEAIENTLSRDGTSPNFMDADLDMNSYRIINSADPTEDNDIVNLKYVEERIGGAVEASKTAVNAASQAANSAQSALVSSTNAINTLRNAENTINQATTLLTETQEYVDNAKADIDGTVALAKSDIESTKDSTIAVVTSTSASVVATIEQTVAGGKQEINTTIEEAQTSLSDTIAQAVEDVKEEATKAAEDAIQNAADEATQVALNQTVAYVENTAIPNISAVKDSAVSELESVLAADKSTLEGYVSSATNQASIATSKANEAQASASAAKTSENNAKTSETNTKTSEANAKTSEINAKSYADSIEPERLLSKGTITNCITEIPQDIKLELNNGTLTLKAGSKVYVPNGVGKFDEKTISSDRSITNLTYNTTYLLFTNTDATFLFAEYVSACSSGTTQPSGTWKTWYDTTNNRVKRFGNVEGTVLYEGSLPIAIFTVSNGTITSIDQVFNGFGYMGSTVFALPNVKGLIPNGRNADGSLRNIEFTLDKVVTRTITWNNAAGQALFIGKYNLNEDIKFISSGHIHTYFQQEDEPSLSSSYVMWYKPSENKIYRVETVSEGEEVVWKENFSCYIGQWFSSGTSPYPITELTTKLPFRAVDYNDVKSLGTTITYWE